MKHFDNKCAKCKHYVLERERISRETVMRTNENNELWCEVANMYYTATQDACRALLVQRVQLASRQYDAHKRRPARQCL